MLRRITFPTALFAILLAGALAVFDLSTHAQQPGPKADAPKAAAGQSKGSLVKYLVSPSLPSQTEALNAFFERLLANGKNASKLTAEDARIFVECSADGLFGQAATGEAAAVTSARETLKKLAETPDASFWSAFRGSFVQVQHHGVSAESTW